MTKDDINIIISNNLKNKPVKAPAFGSFYTNYMFEMDYEETRGWFNPRIKPFADFSLNPAALCFHYGQTIFEGLKVVKVNDKMVLFRPKENFIRMNKSALRMAMPELDGDFVLEALIELLKIDNDWFYDLEGSSIYIRPTMIATQPSLNVVAANQYKFFIILSPSAPYFNSGNVKLITETNYMRVAANGCGEAKNGGNYGGSFIASEKAKKEGYSQVLWLDPVKQKYIEEAGSMNIFFVHNNKLITPPTNGSILKGITRDSIIKIAPLLGYEVSEEEISINELIKMYQSGKLTEAFSSGTAALVTPINTISHLGYEMNFEYTNDSIVFKVIKYFEQLRSGKIDDEFGFIKII